MKLVENEVVKVSLGEDKPPAIALYVRISAILLNTQNKQIAPS